MEYIRYYEDFTFTYRRTKAITAIIIGHCTKLAGIPIKADRDHIISLVNVISWS
jgi:hypothetical protein